MGARTVVAVPGNYGETFLREQMRLPCRAVSCSNYIGELLDMAVDFGFEGLLLVGHAGKLVKLAGGVMNTHSRYADARMAVSYTHLDVYKRQLMGRPRSMTTAMWRCSRF